MIAEILSIGTELLMGQITDTNAQYIATRLAQYGINHYYNSTVGDNWDRLCGTIKTALERSDVVLMTGGLGPTDDDISKEAAAAVMDCELYLDERAKTEMEQRFSRMNRKMTENNLKQAYLPVGCVPLYNKNGTAPGCIINKNDKIIVLMPGPPKEMRPMLDEQVLPYIGQWCDTTLFSKELKIFNYGESALASTLKDMLDGQTNPTIAPYAQMGEVLLRVTASCRTAEEGERIVRPVIDEIRRRVGDYVYSEDGETLQAVCARLIKQSGLKLAAAESCTGGMLSSSLIDIAGSSEWFLEGAVTYSNEAKNKRLGVDMAVIEKVGAVSREVAALMAEGIAKTAGSDIGLSTTGIAGPGGGTAEKPVGLVYVGLYINGKTQVKELRLSGDRYRIRYNATQHALDMLRKALMTDDK